ncbi:hypothetical protein [Anatilimnocola floriformis]|uniref:hypothetical protein n=1 Tax=Anatilimnocola floriformis TaxID=2948575 RepID=UPI0020C36907|nr:hypothetical protein [Anatilimnocola floriformis]
MAERLTTKIRRYCETNGIEIPIGFGRNSASRYAIVELSNPPKLIARTWFKQADVTYYLENLADSTPRRILDFRELDELSFDGQRLERLGKFAV